jgi:hypothetical protein
MNIITINKIKFCKFIQTLNLFKTLKTSVLKTNFKILKNGYSQNKNQKKGRMDSKGSRE